MNINGAYINDIPENIQGKVSNVIDLLRNAKQVSAKKIALPQTGRLVYPKISHGSIVVRKPPECLIFLPPNPYTNQEFSPTYPHYFGINWGTEGEKNMKQIKAGKPLIDFIKLCYASNLSPLLIGTHGVGKSMLLEQAAQELDISYICRDLSLMEPPDLVGMPKLEGGVTRFLPPSFLPTEGRGLLCFEELNRCPNYMRAPCLQLLTARCLNDYRLPDGWLPCAAINPSEANYEVNDLDPALLSRFVKVLIIPDKTEWIRWAKENGISKEITGYVGYDSKVFTDTSPRDWVYVDQLMKAQKESNGITRDILGVAVQGVVGKERAAAFSQYLKSGILLPPVIEILTDYSKYQEQIRELRNNGKTDVLGNVTHELMMYLQDIDNYKHLHNKAEGLWSSLSSFLSDLPADNAKQVEKFMKDKKYEIPANPIKFNMGTPKLSVPDWSILPTSIESIKAPTLEEKI